MDQLAKPGDVIEFQAAQLSFDERANIVSAEGGVTVAREGYRLRADKVTWDRKTGGVTATGNVIVSDPDGNQVYGDEAEVTETLKDATVSNLLLVLEGGGRAAAKSATRVNGVSTLNRAVYSPCAVENSCGKLTPVWQLKAVKVVHDPAKRRLSYESAWLEIGGVPVLYLPRFSHPDGGDQNAAGFLTPDVKIDRVLGLTLETPYYVPLGADQDLLLTPFLFSDANPMLAAEYRRLLGAGPIKFGGYVTYTQYFDQQGQSLTGTGDQLRGYVYANGRLQLDPNWRVTFSGRGASDDTFLRRYDLSQDDVLRNFVRAERFTAKSYFSAEGWAFQGLRVSDVGELTPIALPLLEYRLTPDWKPLGGTIEFLANTLSITRTGGADSQRAIAQARWSRLLTTPLGQRVTVTGQLRADAYHANDQAEAEFAIYAGEDGWHGRALPVGAVDVQWPFAGPALGGVQTVTPRVQFVASPLVTNSAIPNEDSRSIDLDDVNLFDLNRFPGYDRWEGGARITYGLQYTLDRPKWRVATEIGQSYRFSDAPMLFPDGTGLTDNLSDIVGRTTLRYGRFVDLTHRYRLDHEKLSIRRNDIDLTLGTARTYVQLAYTRLNRNIGIEDLRDREEARAAGRLQFRRYWSLYAAGIVDLTSKNEDPLSDRDGFQPIRHRIGLAYEDECFLFSFSWRRDYVSDRDNRSGDTFLFRIAFRNLGR